MMCEMGCAQGHTVTRSALHGCQRGLCLGRYLSCCGVHCVCLCVLLASACHMGLIQSCLGSTDVQSWMSAGMREEARQTCWAEDGEPAPAKLPASRSNAPSSKSLPQLRPCCLTRKSRRDVVPAHLCQRPVGRRLCCSTPCSHRLLGLRLAECCGTRVKTTLTTAVLASTTACSPLWSSRGASSSQVRCFSLLSIIDADGWKLQQGLLLRAMRPGRLDGCSLGRMSALGTCRPSGKARQMLSQHRRAGFQTILPLACQSRCPESRPHTTSALRCQDTSRRLARLVTTVGSTRGTKVR